jgi:bifunctional non-homologous end joining protein LigD
MERLWLLINADGHPSHLAELRLEQGTVGFLRLAMILAGRDLLAEPWERRGEMLQAGVRGSPILDASLPDLIRSVRAQHLEGIVAKRLGSRYEPVLRTGAWQKMRVKQGQNFVIGGYTPTGKNFDVLIFGYYEGKKLMYAARTRNGFTPSLREKLFRRFKDLEIPQCPFANLREARSGRWGEGLTAEKLTEYRWLKPLLVGQFEFLEWTPDRICASYCTSFWADSPDRVANSTEIAFNTRLVK